MSPIYIGFVKAGVFGRKMIDKTAKSLQAESMMVW